MKNEEKLTFLEMCQDAPISSLSWSPDSSLICGASWNNEARIWNFYGKSNFPILSITDKSPILTSWFLNDRSVITGGLDKAVVLTDVNTGTSYEIGKVLECFFIQKNKISKYILAQRSCKKRFRR